MYYIYIKIICSQSINLTEQLFKIIIKCLSINLNNNSISNETTLFLLDIGGGKKPFVEAILDIITFCSFKKDNFIGEDNSINYKIVFLKIYIKIII